MNFLTARVAARALRLAGSDAPISRVRTACPVPLAERRGFRPPVLDINGTPAPLKVVRELQVALVRVASIVSASRRSLTTLRADTAEVHASTSKSSRCTEAHTAEPQAIFQGMSNV